jgi:tetratricopeptide (TPR) repeat protein
MAPDFGMVGLRAEARYGRLANTTDLNWTSPLRNDGQIWPLIDHLDRLMTGPTSHPSVSIQPHMSGIIPVVEPSPKPLASPDPVGEIEMLIALEATHLPIASDEMSMAVAQASFQGPHFDKQRVKVANAIAVLDRRISKESKDAELVSLRGAFHYDLGTYDRAAADFGEAVRLQPHQADHYNNRGMAFYRQGRKKEALADFGKALERNRSKYGHLERLIARMKH